MPSFKKKITDPDDIWSLVNYIRTLKKGGVPVTVVKDTTKKVDKPVKPDNSQVKKDTVAKKDNPVVPKTETIPIQEQVNTLRARVDSLEKEVNLPKEKMNALKKDTTFHN